MPELTLVGYNMSYRHILNAEIKENPKKFNTDSKKEKHLDKAKNRKIVDAVINVNANGKTCMAKGRDFEFSEHVVCATMGKKKAMALIDAEIAEPGEGWTNEELEEMGYEVD